MKSIGKRGSHVEMIISFSMFILFISAVFIMIEPTIKDKGDKTTIINSLKEIILNNVSSNVTLTLIKIHSSYNPSENCITLSEGGWKSGENVVVKNTLEQKVDSNYEDTSVDVAWTGEERFFRVYSSPESLDPILLSSENCANPSEGNDFFISFIHTEKYPFESRLFELNSIYSSSYEELKTSLGIPKEEEFAFFFINSTGDTSISSEKEAKSRNVYYREFPLIYVDNHSNIDSGVLRISVW